MDREAPDNRAVIIAPSYPVADSGDIATSAVTDEQLLASWLDGFNSRYTKANFERTGRMLIAELRKYGGMRKTKVEPLRDAINRITDGLSPSSRRQVLARCKSLFSYANKLGYCRVNVGAVLKI